MTRAKLLLAVCLLLGLTTAAQAQQVCGGDEDCDDGNFCNGMETCVLLLCEPGVPPEGQACDDGTFCTVGDSCSGGACTGAARDCSALDGACTNGVCNEGANTCQAQPANEGGSCNDGEFCTVGDVCTNGTCAGPTPRDCSAFDSACTNGVCNEGANACQAQPANEGGGCNDGEFCTVGDACNNGTCAGSPRDCSAFDGACTNGVCNEAADACQGQPANNGSSCNDGEFCSVGDVCNNGTCAGSTPRDCSAFDGVCASGVCNEAADACQAQPANEGGSCNDGQFCTVGDACSGGTCVGPTPRDCSALNGECASGVCNEAANACQAQPVNEGASCDDGLFCTVGDACDNGTCAGPTARDCSLFDGACANGVCNEAIDLCQPQPINQGGSCNDGLFCTVGDVCTDGTCAGPTPRDCSAFDGACTSGVCSEAVDACQAQPVNQGGGCDDGLFCTVGDACNNGTCAGPTPRDCSALTNACNTGVCSESANACQPQTKNEGGSCPDDLNQCTGDICVAGACQHPFRSLGFACNDGLFCTASDTCNGMGTCVGTGDPCAGGVECGTSCNEVANNCFVANTVPCTDDGNVCTNDFCTGAGACGHPPNTAPCDDALFCNGADVCSGGACTHAGDPCAAGAECANTCNETADDCITPADTPCADDDLSCTTDLCLAGACNHAPVDALCDQGDCVLGVCTPGAPGADKRGCVAATVAEGEQCTDDGFSCTDDTCNAGACLHVPIASRCVPPGDCTSAVCEPGQPTADAAGCIPGPVLEEGQECAEDGEPCTNDLCRTGTCAHDGVPDTVTCEPVTRAFRQALALEGLARHLMASVGEAFAPNTSSPAVVTQGNMVAHLTPVTSSLEQVSRVLSGKSPLPPDAGRVRGVPKTLAQLRAEASIELLKKKPGEVRAFLRLAGTAKRKGQVPRETARTLRSDGRLVLERLRKLNKELRRLRRVSQTFVP